ncbi:MAG: histidine phosphatase family protein [Vicinamibacterales bacterium]
MLKRSMLALTLVLIMLAMASPSAAQPAVFLVRHAERADSAPGTSPTMGADPDLSEAGRTRAESLATLLRDANITAIFATEFKRTQQTAAPLARALGLTVKVIPSKSTADLVKQVEATKGNALVVGHSNSVPDVVKALGISMPVTIGDDDFDNLFIVNRGVNRGTAASLLRLHYR